MASVAGPTVGALPVSPQSTEPVPVGSGAVSGSDPPPGHPPLVVQLKYLSFVRAWVLELYIFLVKTYGHLKDRSGPFKSVIERVEGTVKSVFGPVISRADVRPDEYFKFADTKVDESVRFVENHTPQEWKVQAVNAYEILMKVPEFSRAAVDEYNQRGLAATVHTYYEYFLPTFLAYLAAWWKFILTLPLAPQIVQAAQPLIVFFAQQYNIVLSTAQKSEVTIIYSVARVLPHVPVDKLKNL